MKITEIAIDPKQPVVESVTETGESFVFGVDRHDPLHEKVAKKIEQLRDTDPRLYHKITSLN